MTKLADDVAGHSVSPAGSAAPLDPEDIVLVPPTGAVPKGFDICRRLLDEGRSVRLVGQMVTSQASWPPWARTEPNLIVTELGSYASHLPGSVAHRTRASFIAWVDEIFANITPFEGSAVFFASVSRSLQPLFEDVSLLAGVVTRHRGGRVHCADTRWTGFELLEMLAEENDVTVHAETRARAGQLRWRAKLLALSLGLQLGVLIDHSRWFAKAAPSRRHLAKLRKRPTQRAAPKLWLALVPDWLRMNEPLLSGALPIPERFAESFGILLFAALNPGARSEANMRKHTGSELWPGVGPLKESLGEISVDQIVTTESLPRFLRVFGRSTVRTARVLTRLARSKRVVERPGLRLDLFGHVMPLAKVITQEMFRTTAGEDAATSAAARQDLRDSVVLFSTSGYAPEAVADLVLQRAGATTIEVYHGSADATWQGREENRSTFRCVWTRADQQAGAPFKPSTVVGGMPRRIARHAPRPDQKVRHVLLITNYVHRDSLVRDPERGPILPHRAFQNELLGTVRALKARLGDRIVIRWRPHPADVELAVRETAAKFRNDELELSRGRPLVEDADWCDVVVSAISSAAVELLFADVPIFLHVPPSWRDAPCVTAFDASRRFFYAHDLVEPFVACLDRVANGDERVLDPERAALQALFGPTGTPEALMPCVERIAGAGPREERANREGDARPTPEP